MTSFPFFAERESIQYFSGTNASISFSRSTIIESVGLCTRPTERMPSAPRCAAMVRKRVIEAPQTKSIIWRDSPAAAKFMSRLWASRIAARISSLVIAENRAR